MPRLLRLHDRVSFHTRIVTRLSPFCNAFGVQLPSKLYVNNTNMSLLPEELTHAQNFINCSGAYTLHPIGSWKFRLA